VYARCNEASKGDHELMYLVIGANGYLGNYIMRSILNDTEENIVATARHIDSGYQNSRISWQECDITDDDAFDKLVERVKDKENLKVVFLAAYHQPDLVAQNPELAWNINVTTLSKCVNKLRFAKKLFYASTDSVYGNSVDGYHFKETDALNPVNIYGRNKCAAEAVVIWSGFNVVRFPFLIAPSLVSTKKHFYDRIVESLERGEKVEMFSDSYRSSLNFKTAGDLLIGLMELEDTVPAILNIGGDDDLSKYDIGLMIADKLGVSRDMIVPIKTTDNQEIFKTARATSTLLDSSKVKEVLGIESIKLVI